MAKPHIAFTIGTFDGIDARESELFTQMRRRSKNTPIIFVSPDEKAFERSRIVPSADITRRIELCSYFGDAYSQDRLVDILGPLIARGERLTFYGIKDDPEYARIVESIAPVLKRLHLPRRMLKIVV